MFLFSTYISEILDKKFHARIPSWKQCSFYKWCSQYLKKYLENCFSAAPLVTFHYAWFRFPIIHTSNLIKCRTNSKAYNTQIYVNLFLRKIILTKVQIFPKHFIIELNIIEIINAYFEGYNMNFVLQYHWIFFLNLCSTLFPL